jgi:hypothetical protein
MIPARHKQSYRGVAALGRSANSGQTVGRTCSKQIGFNTDLRLRLAWRQHHFT